MEKVSFEMTKDTLSNVLKIFVKTEIIDKALAELKRKDKSNLAIIQDTIKILENGFILPLEQTEPGSAISPNFSANLTAPLKTKPVPVQLPNTNFFNEVADLESTLENAVKKYTIPAHVAKVIENSLTTEGIPLESINVTGIAPDELVERISNGINNDDMFNGGLR